jgi:hypothetical protein
MSKTVEESLEVISDHAYSIAQELRSSLVDGYFDEDLIRDIGSAFLAWRDRVEKIKDAYCVWYWDGSSWSKVSKDMYQEDAYREWYRLTKGGRKESGPKCDTYYYLGSTKLKMAEKHPVESETDDFSIRYLLSKSFGE